MSAHDKTSLKLLEEAMAQRARCFLSLPVSVTGVRELDCAMLESSTRGLLLESQGKAACGPHWMGLDVTGYFRVILRRNGIDETFYTFDSRIKAAANGRTGIARLLLEEPDSLVFGQRRKSLRVEPDIERIAAAFLWRYDKKEGFVMDCPALKRVDFQGGFARIADISAGGMRLALRGALVRERSLELPQGQRVVVHLQLREPREPGDHEFWIVARVRHAARDCLCGDAIYGFEFLASGRLDAKAGKIRWQPVQEHTIGGLADIFHHWDLDKRRQKVD
jgi:hypothetical protein